MKITNQVLFASVPSLQALANESLEIEATFTVAEALRKIQEALTTFTKLRNEAIKEGCKKDEAGNPLTVEGNADQVQITDECVSTLERLANCEADVAIEQLPLSLFKGAKLKPSDMTNLLWLIKK